MDLHPTNPTWEHHSRHYSPERQRRGLRGGTGRSLSKHRTLAKLLDDGDGSRGLIVADPNG